MADCICDYEPTCGGLGKLCCVGCGGDQCVCRACFGAGEIECDGCPECVEAYDPMDRIGDHDSDEEDRP